MVTTYKISADWDEDNFKLVALHCDLTDYAMAYHVNKAANLKLRRRREDLENEDPTFPVFEWEDISNGRHWMLVRNTIKKEEKITSEGLFQEQVRISNRYLIEAHKEVDFFLKLETEQEHTEVLEQTVAACNAIPKVITAYQINAEELIGKQNLIFL